MNTGGNIITDHLILVPGNTSHNIPFLNMLREDGEYGDFKSFCGIDFSEKYLIEFNEYFERSDHDQCMYAIFMKETEEFVGYVGFQRDGDFEIEFYIARSQRRKGYCEEACRKVISLIFSEGISVGGKSICVDRLYATTLAENTVAQGLLTKLGFEREVTEDGSNLAMEGYFDKESNELFWFRVSKYCLRGR